MGKRKKTTFKVRSGGFARKPGSTKIDRHMLAHKGRRNVSLGQE